MDAALVALRKQEAQVASAFDDALPPKALVDVQLHDYQVTGMRWLLRKHAQKLNPILGDEMGLGKTLQTISFIASLIQNQQQQLVAVAGSKADNVGLYLIVAPLSVLPNWMDQFKRFAPSIATVMHAGTKDERSDSQTTIKSSTQALVVVTSYEVLLSDADLFCNSKWKVAVMDEGHRLKNPKGKLYELLLARFKPDHMVVLSGTPIQNNLQELYALLSLLNPRIFNDETAFVTTFKDYFSAKAQRLDKTEHRTKQFERAEKLMRELLSPLLLLRTIQDVNDSFTLPPISEMIVHTPLSPMQRAYYKEIVTKNGDLINSLGSKGNRVALTNILPQLRKACNHPYLFAGAEPEPFYEGSHLYENSGKLYVLHHILPRLKANGHCVLLFSTSTTFLDIIQDYLTLEGFSYERIDGSVRGKERWQAIERFTSDPETFVFVMSTRSGGVGLNLQRADTVIFADSDYNPQADLQAVARAYRLGQTKSIHVIKFVCAHTIEESIYRRAIRKTLMADKIRNCARNLDTSDDEQENDKEGSLVDMIQFGLHKLLEEQENEPSALTAPLDEAYIQHILARQLLDKSTEKESPRKDSRLDVENEELATAGGDFLEENMYYFDGEDYSKLDPAVKDREAFHKLCREYTKKSHRRGKTARQGYDGEDEDKDNGEGDAIDEAQEATVLVEQLRKREERRQKALEKKLAMRRKNKYESMALTTVEDNDADVDDSVDFANTTSLRFVSGDASRPLRDGSFSASIIVHSVDTSGSWSPRGFFRSISNLSPHVQQQYEAAFRNEDLKLGQAHLIRIPALQTPVYAGGNAAGSDDDDDDDANNRPDVYVCLLVVQGFVSASGGRKKLQRPATGGPITRPAGRSTNFRLYALQNSLRILAQHAKQLNASVHMPRIGYGTPQFNWYAVERIIRRELRDANVATCIYYYSPTRRT